MSLCRGGQDFEGAIFMIVVADAGDTAHEEVGTGFVIALEGQRVIGVTATHTLGPMMSRILLQEREFVLEERLSHLPKDAPKPKLIERPHPKNIVAIFSIANNFYEYRVADISINDAHDISIIILEPKNAEGCLSLIRALAISTYPNPSERLGIIGILYAPSSPAISLIENTNEIFLQIKCRLKSSDGILIQDDDEYRGHVPGPVFYSNLHVAKGMSGSPILDRTLPIPAVCGIASSAPKDVEDFSVCSVISSAFGMHISNGETIWDWIRQGRICTVGFPWNYWDVESKDGVMKVSCWPPLSVGFIDMSYAKFVLGKITMAVCQGLEVAMVEVT